MINKKGSITPLALILIIIISIEAIYLGYKGYKWMSNNMSDGNDALYVNTAESEAKVNSLNGVDCPVHNCGNSSGDCIHHTSIGYVGYFDSVTNTIIATKPKGYNSQTNPKIDGKEYIGNVETMVIRVTVNNNMITLDWVKGN